MQKFTHIDNEAALKKAVQEWEKEKEVGIDLECENNLHHYGTYIALIQMSTRKHRWIVDALKIKDMKPLVRLLENPDVQKIFHDVGFDLRILYHQYDCKVKNVFDTQIAAHLLAKKDLGLGALLKEYFGVEKEKKFQMADWTKRPLKEEMLEYAVKDTKYLILLRDILRKELRAAKRWEWAKEDFKALEKKDWGLHEPDYNEIKGFALLSPRQRGMIKQVYQLRSKLAKKVDRPVHFVISTKKMVELVKQPPTLRQWQELKGVHPAVRRQARAFYDAVEKGKKSPIEVPKRVIKRYTLQQRHKAARLNEISVKIEQDLGLPKHLVLNKEQIKQIVLTGKKDGLRSWQRKILVRYEMPKKKKTRHKKKERKK